MAHHSHEPMSDDFRRIFDDLRKDAGPTGRFPLGKLTPQDEGEIAIAFTHMKGKVVIDFGKPTAWIGFTPEQAEQIADTLREHAAKARASA
jgi:ABC-type arginine transport system ATPase subunit